MNSLCHEMSVFAIWVGRPLPHVDRPTKERCAFKQHDRITDGLLVLISDEAERVLAAGGLLDSYGLQGSGLEVP